MICTICIKVQSVLNSTEAIGHRDEVHRLVTSHMINGGGARKKGGEKGRRGGKKGREEGRRKREGVGRAGGGGEGGREEGKGGREGGRGRMMLVLCCG